MLNFFFLIIFAHSLSFTFLSLVAVKFLIHQTFFSPLFASSCFNSPFEGKLLLSPIIFLLSLFDSSLYCSIYYNIERASQPVSISQRGHLNFQSFLIKFKHVIGERERDRE